MKEAFEKIKERLEEETYDMEICEEQFDADSPYFIDVPYKMVKLQDALSIVSEVEAEFGKDINVRGNKSTEHINKSSDCSTNWIPCSERLPENDDDVLVWYRYRMMRGVNIVGSKGMHGIGYYYKPTGSWLIYDGFGLDQNVIAWMPLPEPWKGEQG